MLDQRMSDFRKRCVDLGLAHTHQRMVIYRAFASSESHPTPESVFEQVRREIPSISLGTVYKSIRTFVDNGLLREVNVLHETVRLDANLDDHHHLVCIGCKSVTDVPAEMVQPVELRGALPEGFRLKRSRVEILGVCASCAAKEF